MTTTRKNAAAAASPNEVWRLAEQQACTICATPFRPRDRRAKYCGPACAHVAEQRRQRARATGVGKGGTNRGKWLVPRRTCETCGKQFYAQPKLIRRGGGRFCSKKCKGVAMRGPANKWYKGKIQQTCRQCGKTFERFPSQDDAAYCSTECRDRSRALPRHACAWCGKVACLPTWVFCSSACYFAARIEKAKQSPHGVETKCEMCGKTFRVVPAVLSYGYGRFCGRDCFSKWRSQTASASHTRARGGRRVDLDNRYFRSAWEANYARYLNWLGEHEQIAGWDYEVDTFDFPVKRGARFYTPDFKVTKMDGATEYHEVKGWMDAQSATKMRRMQKYHPTVKVVLIDKPAYYGIARVMRDILPGWERVTERMPAAGQIASGEALDWTERALRAAGSRAG